MILDGIFATSVSALVLVYLRVIHSYYTTEITAIYICKSICHKQILYCLFKKYYIHLYLYLYMNTDIKFAPNRSKPQMMSKHVVTQCSTTNVGRDAGCQDMLSNINLYVSKFYTSLAWLCGTHPPLNPEIKHGTERWTLRKIHSCLRSFRNHDRQVPQ